MKTLIGEKRQLIVKTWHGEPGEKIRQPGKSLSRELDIFEKNREKCLEKRLSSYFCN